MQVRVDQIVDLGRVDVDRREPRRNLLARLEVDVEQLGQGADARLGIRLCLRVQTAVEEHLAARMVDEEAGNRDAQAALLAGEETAHRTGQPTAGEGEEARHAQGFAFAFGCAGALAGALGGFTWPAFCITVRAEDCVYSAGTTNIESSIGLLSTSIRSSSVYCLSSSV